MALPQRILDMAELTPIEDIGLAILRETFEPEIPVFTLIPEQTPEPPFLLTRKAEPVGDWEGDPRFTDVCRLSVDAYTAGADADGDGALLAEAVRICMRNAWFNTWHRDDLGTVIEVRITQEPIRETDWVTATGPVQFADLPDGWFRYEATYLFTIRKPRNR